MGGRIFLEGNYGRLGCQKRGSGERQTQGARELPARCFAGRPSAGSRLRRATGGRLGCPGPLGAASVQRWQGPLPQIIPSLGNVQGQEPMAPFASPLRRGSSSFGMEAASLLGCPLVIALDWKVTKAAVLRPRPLHSSLSPQNPTALVPPPDTQPPRTTWPPGCWVRFQSCSQQSPVLHLPSSRVSTRQPSSTPYTQRSLTRTLPSDPQRTAWLRPGLPCCKGPPLSSQPLSSSISLTTGSTRYESASPGPSSFWIFHSRLSFSFQPHLRGNPGPGFIPAEPGPEQQPQDAFALSLPHPCSQGTRTRSHSPALTNPTQMTFPTLTVVGLSFPFLFFLLRHLSQAAILLTSPAHHSGTPSAGPTPGPLLGPLWSCVSLSPILSDCSSALILLPNFLCGCDLPGGIVSPGVRQAGRMPSPHEFQ